MFTMLYAPLWIKPCKQKAWYTAFYKSYKTSTTYPVEKGGPPLHGDALENSQHGVQNVVKRRYAKIGTLKEERKLFNSTKPVLLQNVASAT
jgi:hypothetical protein